MFSSNRALLALKCILVAPFTTYAFSVQSIFAASVALPPTEVAIAPALTPEKSVNRIAVTGATGRTGSLVVRELLNRGFDVVALVRDMNKAENVLGEYMEDDSIESDLQVMKCDLGSEKDIIKSVEGCDAAIWCATGFSNAPGASILDKASSLVGALFPKMGIDMVGVSALGNALKDGKDPELPKVIMLSSAGVTRPKWDDEKKEKYAGCADIPIVRLNPFGILDIKVESENALRETGVPYSIFRPTGLNNDHPEGSRPVFSQGDVAVGRINRKDCAKILVDCLTEPDATGKTFEAFTLSGYSPPSSIKTQLSRLKHDSEGVIPEEVLENTYYTLQQLLPGETQDAAALAMGQTYEQLDKGETGRLGKRGEESIAGAGYRPSK